MGDPGKALDEKVQNLKAATTVSTSTLDQYLISQYLAEGAFVRHLSRLRNALKKQVVRTALAIQKHFPSGTRLAIPDGGTLLWIELPPQVVGLEVYRRALQHHIAIIPGVALDEKGGRIGSGEGYYDRFIGNLPITTRKVALSLECQIVQQIPMESHDKYMDIIIT